MHTVSIIPCLDFKDGRVVKGVSFVDLKDAGDPVLQAAHYEADGADELAFLDINATVENRRTRFESFRAVARAIRIPITLGGGIRSLVDVEDALEAGAAAVSVRPPRSATVRFSPRRRGNSDRSALCSRWTWT